MGGAVKKIKFWFENNALGWGILKHILVVLFLAALTVVVNDVAVSQIANLPDFFFIDFGQAESLLSTLAGSMLTVTIFLYSTTVAVLTMYSSQFTPRVIENFSNSKLLSRVLGTFLGGTVYCMLLLFLVDNVAGKVSLLVPMVGAGYTLLGIIQFIAFIVSVSKSMQVQNVLSALAEQTEEAINTFIISRKGRTDTGSFDTREYQHTYQIHAKGNGFFEDSDFSPFASLLRSHEGEIIFFARVGDFVSTNQHIADLHYNGEPLNENATKKLSAVLVLEDKRYIDNDYRFAFQKIVEIALKGLSPSINDPNTAIYCLRHLGVLAGRLAQVEGDHIQMAVKNSVGTESRIIHQDFSFEEDMKEMFVQIIYYGKGDLYLVAAVLEALHTALLVSSDAHKSVIYAMVDYVFEEVGSLHQNPTEQNYLAEKQKLFLATNEGV